MGFELFSKQNKLEKGKPQDRSLKSDRWIRNFKALVHSQLDTRHLRREDQVKLAILDTGIDLHHSDFHGESRVKSVRSWVGGRAGREEDHRAGDRCGHGTHVAGLILDLVPNVDIYVAQVAESRQVLDKDNVAQAIAFARTAWKVDVLVIPFGFDEGVGSIQHELEKALNDGIVVFAATANDNDGPSSRRLYPARHDRVFAIHSTDGYGNRSRFNPTPLERGDNFAILGEDVLSAWPGGIEEAAATRRLSGTSVATAVAAALAAFVMGYVRQKLPAERSAFLPVRGYSGMKQVFYLMMQERDFRCDYLSPFVFFGKSPVKVREDIMDALRG